MMEFEMTAAHI